MQDFDINLAPGGVRVIDCQADYIYYRAGSAGGADAAIEFASSSGGETVFLYPGQAYRIPARAAGMASSWAMKNRKGEATIIGSVILGEGEFQDNRISGSVEVIDGGRNRTLAGQAFMGGGATVAGAALYSTLQLWNPVGSIKRLVVKNILIITQVDMSTRLRTALGISPQLLGNVANKNLGAALSVAEVRADAVADVSGANFLSFPIVKANTPYLFQLQDPIVIAPGKGLSVEAAVTNSYLGAAFEFNEEAI